MTEPKVAVRVDLAALEAIVAQGHADVLGEWLPSQASAGPRVVGVRVVLPPAMRELARAVLALEVREASTVTVGEALRGGGA